MKNFFGFFALGLIFVGGCASSAPAAAPVIDDLKMPATATVATDGTYKGMYVIQGTISYHDSAKVVTTIRIAVPSAGASFDNAVAGAEMAADTPVIVVVSGSAPKGTLEYDVSLVDQAGTVGAALKETVTLQ